jgi:hypothetical protein
MREGGLAVLPNEEQLRSVSFVHLAAFSALFLFALTMRIVRWHWQLKPIGPVPMHRIFSTSCLANAAVVLLPFRSGELIKPTLISRSSSVPFMAALATSGCERIIDALSASILLIVSLTGAQIREPLPERIGDLPIPASVVPTLGYSAAAVTLAASALVLFFFYFRAPTIRLIKALSGLVSPRLGTLLEEKLTELTLGFEFLKNLADAGKYLGTTFAYWASHLLAIWYLLLHTGFASCTLAQAGVVLGTIAFSASLPNAPGFFGIFQIAIYASLALFYPVSEIQAQGSVAAFWLYALEIGWVLALAPLAWVLRLLVARKAALGTESRTPVVRSS